MDNLWQRLFRRFDRRPPRARMIYGRRTVSAPGFSLAELAEVDLDPAKAADLGVPVCLKRLTSLGSNVERLREFLAR